MKFKYNWENYLRIENFLTKLYNNTLEYLSKGGYSLDYALEFIWDIEDFLYYMIIKHYDIERVLSCIEEIEYIGFMKYTIIKDGKEVVPNYKMLPSVINSGMNILLNPSISGDSRLTDKERRRLCLYHGLSHNILGFKNENTKDFSKKYSDMLPGNKNTTQTIVSNGWLLLEETLAQEIAEMITYEMIGKKRPGLRPGIEKQDLFPIDGDRISSNLEEYRMFQSMLVSFAMTINRTDIMSECTPFIIMYRLFKKSIDEDFTKVVLSEYIENNRELELYQLLYLMGLLVNEKYATYGLRPIKNIVLDNEEIDDIFTKIYRQLHCLISMDKNNLNISNQEIKNKIRRLILEHDVDL